MYPVTAVVVTGVLAIFAFDEVDDCTSVWCSSLSPPPFSSTACRQLSSGSHRPSNFSLPNPSWPRTIISQFFGLASMWNSKTIRKQDECSCLERNNKRHFSYHIFICDKQTQQLTINRVPKISGKEDTDGYPVSYDDVVLSSTRFKATPERVEEG